VFAGVKASIDEAMAALDTGFGDLLVKGRVDATIVILAIVLAALAAAAEAMLIVRMARRISRNRRMERDPAVAAKRQLDFILKLFVLMERRGLVSHKDQTLRESARAAAEKLHVGSDLLDELVGLYYRLRWGQVAPTPAQLADAQAKAQTLKASLRA